MKNLIFALIFLATLIRLNAQDCNCDKTIKVSDQFIDGKVLNAQPGDTVCLMAGNKTQLKLFNFHGTEGNPIVFINCGGAVVVKNSTAPYVIVVSSSSFFRFTGTGDANITYGIKAFGSEGSGVSIDNLSTNFELDHLEIGNNGFAGIMAKTDPRCDLSSNRGNFIQHNTIIHDNYIYNTGGEGLYIGNSFFNGYITTCNGVKDTLYPHELHGVRIFKNIVEGSVGMEFRWVVQLKIVKYIATKL